VCVCVLQRSWSMKSMLRFLIIGPISSIFDVTTFLFLWFSMLRIMYIGFTDPTTGANWTCTYEGVTPVPYAAPTTASTVMSMSTAAAAMGNNSTSVTSALVPPASVYGNVTFDALADVSGALLVRVRAPVCVRDHCARTRADRVLDAVSDGLVCGRSRDAGADRAHDSHAQVAVHSEPRRAALYARERLCSVRAISLRVRVCA
jgi:hypothetical protein